MTIVTNWLEGSRSEAIAGNGVQVGQQGDEGPAASLMEGV
jgi:hypothetical protein